jgi:hypothetical protein
MRIEITGTGLDKAEGFLNAFGSRAKKAVTRSVNRTVAGVRTDVVKEVRQEYAVNAKTVRSALSVRKATRGSLEAFVDVAGTRLPLIRFAPRPSKPEARRPKAGVSVMVKKGQRKSVSHAFVARMKSGHVGVFQRSGGTSLPIEEKYSLAVPQMVARDNVRAKLQENALARFEKNLDHEMGREMGVK